MSGRSFMKRFPVPLVVLVAIVLSAPVFTQAPSSGGQVRPGTATPGAQVPGLPPPRDTRGAPQTGTAKLRGRVLAQTATPLRRAQISVTSAEGQVRRTTTTDGDGRYEFIELPAGRYSVSATKAGFVTLQYGQRRPYEAGTPV